MTASSFETDNLAARYPRTIAAFAAMGALDHIDRIQRLDATWDAIRRSPTLDSPLPSGVAASLYTLSESQSLDSSLDYDLIYAGGGLGLIHAAVMARRYGYRVLVFDRGKVGCAHREWNVSRAELARLVTVGFCDWDELADVIMAEYDRGVVRFYAEDGRAQELWMREVLNVAIDAGALLRLARHKLETAGGMVLDERDFQSVKATSAGAVRVEVELARADAKSQAAETAVERYRARLLLDGMGSGSPLALRRFHGRPFAAVCPTVGTVASGFVAGCAPRQHDPQIGDILISVAHAQYGQQYMWEGFPGRGDDLTVYLFYYDTLNAGPGKSRISSAPTNGQSHAKDADHSFAALPPSAINLMQLFEDYFALLPNYKQPGAEFRHHKPVYGYIPARHSVRRQEAPLLRGVLPIGDSAAQQSPLTFCGFGAHIRNLNRTTMLLHQALRHDLLEPRHLQPISSYQVNVSLNWVFSRFMQPWRARDDVNILQNIFLAVLTELGEELAQRFFRDQMRWGDYHRMVLGMFRHHPQIVVKAWHVLGPNGIRRWVADYLAYSGAAFLATGGRRLGPRGRAGLLCLVERVSPALGLQLRARFAEWQSMGWI